MSNPSTPSNAAPAAGTPTTAAPVAPAPAAAAPVVPAPGAPKPTITIDDFLKLDLRVAKIVTAENHPKADRLFKLSVDDGSGTPRTLCAGIREHYTAEQLVGRMIIIVANLAPRELRGVESRGMLLAASNVPKSAIAGGDTANAVRHVILLKPDGDIEPGSIVG